MRNQPFKHYVIFEVEKEASKFVFSFLIGIDKYFLFNPEEIFLDSFIHKQDEVLIMKNMVLEFPLLEKKRKQSYFGKGINVNVD